MKKVLLFAFSLIAMACFGQAQTENPLPVAQDSVTRENKVASLQTMGISKAAGDSAYIREEYAAAIQIYEALLKEGESAAIYYNLGNSYYKKGEIAKAILNYERALLLQPGDNDARANLEIARSKTIDKVEPIPEIFFVSWAKSLMNYMNVDAWAICGIVAFVLSMVALGIFFFGKQVIWRKTGFFSAIVLLFVVLAANLFAAHQKALLLYRNEAIIMQPSVTIRSTPSESGTSLFILHEGRKVSIKDQSMKNWKEISLEDGKVGWIPADAIEVI